VEKNKSKVGRAHCLNKGRINTPL